ncbi:MAG TPA: class I poly(R)-hydroxyalkanoic acid synthase [Burkholderiales bacterium]|nr:class I poly(R)-hydroxyalkanoic acid synthase [Burkholderiales bacterium]
MSSQPESQSLPPDNEASRKLLQDLLKNLSSQRNLDSVGEIFQLLTASAAQDTQRLMGIHNRFYQKQVDLWMKMLERKPGETCPPVVAPEKGDRRFQSAEWSALPLFDYLKQYYLLSSQWLLEIVEAARVDPEAKKKLRFFTRQYIDALSPTNFPATNPEVLKLAAESNGATISQGLKNLIEDLEKGHISMTDESAFEVGRNLATTSGAVVFENELIQLIQYKPLTETVGELPLLIIPPCINKYYVLDLQPENSFVRHCLEQGNTVFIVSWRNIPHELGHLTWDDYLELGVIQAIDVALAIAGVKKLNTLGFCVGGTLLACALAALRAKRRNAVNSLTLLATMLDFSDTGEISAYVDEAYVQKREAGLGRGGIIPGRELALAFASLRANELVWFYVVNNYLKGKTPDAFDLLYWNCDGTNLPGPMYIYYVRNMYLENSLKIPGKLAMCGVPVDLTKINLPTYMLAAREDHIVPWKSAYASASLLKGRIEFVLTASGHIAGVVNPPAKSKRSFYSGGALDTDAEAWLAATQSHPGSWWPHWSAWLAQKRGKEIPARTKPGNKSHREIEAAPGRYVTECCARNDFKQEAG